MRYQLIAPTPGVVFAYILHGHSHVMFLGWVFNMLYLAFVTEFDIGSKRFTLLFWVLQIFVVGMLLSFPLQGYGLYSIVFTTLHTFGVYIFIILFFLKTRMQSSLALTLAKAALLFFVLSSAGPFYLGYLKASGQGHSNIYRFAIYFYLHFQYNGFFLFAILGLLMNCVKNNLSSGDYSHAKAGIYLLIGTCVPCYLLSILWAEPGIIFNIIGFLSAIMQCLGLILLLNPFRLFLHSAGNRYTRLLLLCSVTALFLKCMLQVFSAVPAMAILANEFRSIVIAYLHLVLLGFVSFFVIGWMQVRGVITANLGKPVVVMLFGFVVSEALIALAPWPGLLFNMAPMVLQKAIFLFSVVMVFAVAWIAHVSLRNLHPKSH